MNTKVLSLAIILTVLLCSLPCLTCIVGVTTNILAVRHQQHYLFCELLRPNMTREEASEVLSQFGSYRENVGQTGTITTVRVVYENLLTSYRFGGETVLYFKDNLLIGKAATDLISGELRGICKNWYDAK